MTPTPVPFPSTGASRDFLRVLQSRDTLVFYCPDGEDHYPTGFLFDWQRGQGATLSPHVATARMPPHDLVAYHRSLGIGPSKIFCPHNPGRTPVATAMLGDAKVLEEISSGGSLRRVCFAYKDAASERLADRLGLEPVYCTPPISAYGALNDKGLLAASGQTHGFSTLPVEVADNAPALDAAFRSIGGIYGEGCMLRLRRGTAGNTLHHARTPAGARLLWRRLRPHGEVLLTPFVPSGKILRNLALHGISTPEGFIPLALTDQIIRRYRFRGARVIDRMEPGDLEAVRSVLPGLGSWLRAGGYVHAPAGVDGFLMDTPQGRRFVVVDPNIRMTGTIRPWSIATRMGEIAGRSFAWQVEWFAFFGSTLTLGDLRRRLGTDLLDPDHPDRGGILPSCMGPFGFRPFGMLLIEVILLGLDPEHLDHLRKRVLGIGPTLPNARE